MAFVDIDKNPATKSQNAAPAPPILIAMATPPILPTPTVPDTAVASARKWLISPFAFGSAKSPRTCLTANQKPRILTKPRYTVKKRAPAASHATTRGTLTPKRLIEKNTTLDNAAASGDKKLSIAAASASMYESLFFDLASLDRRLPILDQVRRAKVEACDLVLCPHFSCGTQGNTHRYPENLSGEHVHNSTEYQS